MSRFLKSAMMSLLVPAVLTAQGPAKKPIEGVWKIAELVVTGANAAKDVNPQPSLLIITQGHYSETGVEGNKPRALYKAEQPTAEEKIAAYDSFYANAGTYEVNGTTLTIHPMVARNPNYMAGGFMKYQFRIEGNTLWLTNKTSDLNIRVGLKVVASALPANETRTKYVRVE